MAPSLFPKKTLASALDTYDAAMATSQSQGVTNEEATRLAFSTLLDTLARPVGWALVLEKKLGNRPQWRREESPMRPQRGFAAWRWRETQATGRGGRHDMKRH